MIKVLHSELAGRIGGIETFLLNLTKCIDRNKVQFEFLSRKDNPVIEQQLKNYGCIIHKVSKNYFKYCNEVKQIIDMGNYDIVHIHKNSAADIILPIIAKCRSDAHIIVHSHNTKPQKSSFLKIVLHTINRPFLTKIADSYFTCSDLAANWLYGNRLARKADIKFIKNGIVTERYKFDPKKRKCMREKLGIQDNFVIGHVGRFNKQKNHKFLIDIINNLNNDRDVLLLVGDGVLYKEVTEYVKQLNLEDKVFFLGERNDVDELMQAMDIFVMPSLWEGLPISCVEAQASGLPVLLSKDTSQMCAITDNVTFLSIDDVQTWCRYIDKVRNNFIRHDVSSEIIEAGFDMKNTASFLENFYKENAKNRKS